MEKYRTDQYGSVYEYDADHGAYVFIGKLNGQSLEGFLSDLEQSEIYQCECE